MRITVNKKEFASALSNALKITNRKSNLSITECVLIEACEGAIRISASNLDQMYQKDISATVDEPCKAALDCKNLYNIVTEYPESEITISESGSYYRIGSKTGPEFNILGSDPNDFPEIVIKYGESVEFEGKAFSDIIKKTCFIQGKPDDGRPHIKGVLFNGFAGKQLRIYSTDNSMVSRHITDKEFSGKYIVTKTGLSSISVGEKVSISFSESTAFFETNGATWGIRLLEGDFPDCDGICDIKNPEIEFDSYDIFDLLKRAKTMNSEEYKSINLEFNKGKLIAKVNNPDIGEFVESIDMDLENDVTLAVNTKFLYSIICATNDDSKIQIFGEKRPVIVRDGSFVFAIMPMSL